jgi:HAE1 family hydrophobic/amphiphilic exporter-1
MENFFVRRPIVAIVISIVIVLLGVVSMMSLPVSQYPNITPPEVQVTTSYRGASAVNVEQAVTTPIEQKVNGVEKMLYMKSTNSSDGSMTLRVTFDVGTDMDIANMLTQNRVAQGQASLPNEVKNEGVVTKKSLSFPMILISLTGADSIYGSDFLSNYASINLVDPLSRIEGVGQVNLFGGSEYAMRIWLKPDKLAKLNLSVNEVMQAVKEQNTIASGGALGAPPYASSVDYTYTVVLQDRLNTEQQFKDIVIKTTNTGEVIRLQDVAQLEFGIENYNTLGRVNSKNAAVVSIYQVPGSNAIEVAALVKEQLLKIEKTFPPGLKYEITLDTTRSIEEGIHEIIHTLFEAILLVILVVLLFLQDWRATIIPLLTVPVSLLGTFILFPLLGFSINNLSLLGLVLAIGIVVDDAIVVVEAVIHNMEHGMSPKEATNKAMKEIAGPVMAIALILAAVFIPVAFIPGISGSLYQQFAVTIAISVLFSALNALTLSPALASLLLKPKKERKKNVIDKFFDGFNFYFNKLTKGYSGLAGILVRKSIRGMVLIIVMSSLIFVVVRKIPGGFLPSEDQGYFMVNVQLPDASSLSRTNDVCRRVERLVKNTAGVKYATTIIGYSMLSQSNASYNAALFVTMEEWADRRHVKEIIKEINFKLLQKVPEATCFAFEPPPIDGLGTSAGFSMVLQDKSGKDPAYLAKQTAMFMQELNKRPEINRVTTTYRADVPQFRLVVDVNKAKKLAVNIDELNKTVNTFLGGAYVNDINLYGKRYKVLMQSDATYRMSENDLSYYYVRSTNGQMIPLNTLVELKHEYGPSFTNRFNMLRSSEISGIPAEGYSSGQAMSAIEEVAASTLSQDMGFEWTNLSYQEKKAEGKAGIVFIFAIVMVFLILAAQYESWGLPFSVLLVTPVAILGAFIGLWIMNLFDETYVNNIFAQISLIMLIGLSAKNAILIVEFAKVLVEEGKSIKEAALESARLRFRPILMTALAFILGVVPLLTATGAGAEARKVMGIVVFSGMAVATIIGVVIIPSMFVFVETLIHKKNQHE